MNRIFLWLAILSCCWSSLAYAEATNVEFNYNGVVRVEGEPYTGKGYFKFSIINGDGSTTFWSNDGSKALTNSEPTSAVMINVIQGFFSVNVGDDATTGMATLNPSIFKGEEQVYLCVWFSDGLHGFERLMPDRKIVNPALLSTQSSVQQLDVYVNGTTGDNSNNGYSAESAKKSIQAAIDILPTRIVGGATVHIAPGVYRERVNIVDFQVASNYLTILGDETTVPTVTVNPSVRITGSDDDLTAVRSIGMVLGRTGGVIVKGIWFDRCGAYGMNAYESSSRFINCKATNNAMDGLVGSDCEIEFISCVSTNNGQNGLYCGRYLHAIFQNCISEHNGHNGIASVSMAWLNVRGGSYQYNGYNGMHIDEGSMVKFSQAAANIKNNSQYGIRVSNMAHTQLYSINSFSGNVWGNTYVENGGQLY